MHSTTTTTFFIIVVSVAISTCYSEDDDKYTTCARNLSCGQNFQNVGYPFWGEGRPQDCGHPSFELSCQNEYLTIKINNRNFTVRGINQFNHIITIASLDLWDTYCPAELHNFTFDNLLSSGPMNENLFMFYNCTSRSQMPTVFPNSLPCETGETESHVFYTVEVLYNALENSQKATISCNQSLKVPILGATVEEIWGRSLSLQEGLRRGFEVVYQAYYTVNCSSCKHSGGICGSDSSGFVCHCSDGTERMTCQNRAGNKRDVKLKFAIAFGASGFTLLVVGVLIFLHQRRHKKRYGTSPWTSRNVFSRPSSTTDLEQSSAFYGVHIFKYSELEKATGNFDPKKELGDGGFGTVYQGKLKDGRVVAVKRLYEHNYKRMEQFMNEVEILARLRHQNLVSLYGCTSRHCRELLLVYEYVPNGTVADHLHGDRAKPGSLSWMTRMSIAVETATALAYLHASDVIHRDVKTNNILLDSNFCVKVADFGLSRLFPNNVSHVSTAPQGTPGYVDPEYHECYQLTVKSDVYSFAVVLIELISSQPAVDITRHRHEINLSTMAVNKIQNHALHELVDPFLGFETDFKVREMISEVAELAFQCLQNDKDMRPSMETVLETLKGIQSEDGKLRKAEEVEIPCDEVVLLRCDRSTISPDSTVEISSGITPHGSS